MRRWADELDRILGQSPRLGDAPDVPKTVRTAVVGVADIPRAILVLRGHRVLLDEALAELYGVETKVLIQAAGLRSQIVTSKPRRGGRRQHPDHAYRAL